MKSFILACAFSAWVVSCAEAFQPSQPLRLVTPRTTTTTTRKNGSYVTLFASSNSVVVLSPPGGVGEAAAVEAASQGATVRWFVVSSEESGSSSIAVSPQILKNIESASGKLDVASANADEIMEGGDALTALQTWCGSADCVIGTYDAATDKSTNDEKLEAAIRVAASQVQAKNLGISLVGAEQDIIKENDKKDNNEGGSVLQSLFGKSGPTIPTTLEEALSGTNAPVCTVRYGTLFGLPESSPDFSPLVGGPKRQPVLCDEYSFRGVRIDPFVLRSGTVMASSTLRTSRPAVGEAAALFATGKLSIPSENIPLFISSQAGTEEVAVEEWQAELDRVEKQVASGQAATLYSTGPDTIKVENVERLSDWFATKWAPAVLRTYDIATIRKGARPVYATRAGPGKTEIVWQELVGMETQVVGKLILEVTEDGVTATRGAGNASQGYGSIASKPLPGEDVLVRRLVEGMSQATEKGLARKIAKKKEPAPVKEAPPPISNLQSAGTVDTPAAPMPDNTTGPRQAGARRSTERTRGKRTRKTPKE